MGGQPPETPKINTMPPPYVLTVPEVGSLAKLKFLPQEVPGYARFQTLGASFPPVRTSGRLPSGWAGNRSRVMEGVLAEKPFISFVVDRNESCDHGGRG